MSKSPTSRLLSLRPDLLQRRGAHRRQRRYSRARFTFGALGISSLCFLTVAAFGTQSAVAATAPVNVGLASSFAVLAGSTITNTGSSVVTGDIGLYPGSSVTGIPPLTYTGTEHVADSTAMNAQGAATAAFTDASTRTPYTTVAADLGGQILPAGVYFSSSSMALTGAVTLNGGGDPNAVFIFEIGSTLTTASASSVVLENGASACNVFWQVGSSATLGTTTSFAGTLVASSSATLNTGATVNGRIIALNGAVTLDGNTITNTCSASVATTTTTSATSTTSTTTTTTPVTTTTRPVTTTTRPVTTTTSSVVPIGSPATGFGGMAGSGFSPRELIGWIALSLAVGAGTMALWTRRRSINGRS
jgi:hypothetical protein